MRRRLGISVVAGVAAMTMAADAAYCCSPAELVQKQKAFADAAKAAFARDPNGDADRQAKARLVIDRYGGLRNSNQGSTIIDMICKENDELLAIHK